MYTILQNPYRIIGQLVGTSLREQTRQISRLKQYIEAEEDPPEAYSLPILGAIDRSKNNVNDAASKLDLDIDKIAYGLFWFYNGNEITDEPAIESLKDGRIQEAELIWTKMTNAKDITIKNASAFFNLSTLLISKSVQKYKIEKATLNLGIKLKLQFIESGYLDEFTKIVADATYRTSKHALQILFLNQLQIGMEHSDAFSKSELLEILSTIEFSAKGEFLKVAVEGPIADIEIAVGQASRERALDNGQALRIGTLLYDNQYKSLYQLSNILSSSNFQYVKIADTVAEEVLQCVIDYFLHYKDSDIDPGVPSFDLCKKAQNWATGNILKERFDDTIKHLKDWNDDQPKRVKIKSVKSELSFVESKFSGFQNRSNSLTTAKDLIETCKPKLFKIKDVLGKFEESYLAISSAIVRSAQNMIVAAVNECTENFSKGAIDVFLLKSSLGLALDLTYNLESFDCQKDEKPHFNTNLNALKSICIKVGLPTLSPKGRLQQELQHAEVKLIEIQKQTFFAVDINRVTNELSRIKEWQFLRSEADKKAQIIAQQNKLNQLFANSAREKDSQITNQKAKINNLKTRIQQADH